MRVCHVSTFWPNRLGLTHYTNDLISGILASRPEKQFVAGEGNTAAADTDAYEVLPCWSREGDYVRDVVGGVLKLRADIAYLQYTDDVFGDDERFVRLLRALRDEAVPTIVSMHSVYDVNQRSGFRPGGRIRDFDRAMAGAATRIHVHSEIMREDLLARGVPGERVAVIPHGTVFMDDPGRAESRGMLGIPADARVVMFFGFVWLGKGLDFLLTVMSKVIRRVPDAFLYVGGYTRHKRFYGDAYMAFLRARIALHGMRERTRFFGQYVPEEVVPAMFSAADIVAFPYRQSYSSVSGVVHQTAGMGKLPLCNRIAKFDEVGRGVSPELLIDCGDVRGWVRQLERLLGDEAYGQAMRERVSAWAEATRWEVVGRQHVALQDAVLAESPALLRNTLHT